MKCILRRHIYICLALLPGCGYVFDPDAFTFVKVPVDAVSTDTQGEQLLNAVEASPTAESAARRNVNRRRDRDRSSPRSDEVSDEGEVTESPSSAPQPSSGVGNTDDSSITPSQPSSDVDDQPSGDDDNEDTAVDDTTADDASPSVPDANTTVSDETSPPGDDGNIDLGGAVDVAGKPGPDTESSTIKLVQ